MTIIFDIEGAIIDGEFLPEVAKLVGRGKEVEGDSEGSLSGL
jgi:hypothetical protein